MFHKSVRIVKKRANLAANLTNDEYGCILSNEGS